MAEITIRIATKDDIAALIAVGDDLFDYPVKPDRINEFFEDSRHHLVIALMDDKVTGMASGFHYIHPDKDPVMFINEVSVLEAYHNQKIGRGLVRFLCDHAISIGCYEAWVATEESNLPAQRAYIAAGGKPDEEQCTVFIYDLKRD